MLSHSVRARAAHSSARSAHAAAAASRLSTSSTPPLRSAATHAPFPIASTSRLTLDAARASSRIRDLSTSAAARASLVGPLRSSGPLAYPRAPRFLLREDQDGESGEHDGNEGGRKEGESEDEPKIPIRRPGVPEKDQPRNGLKTPESGSSAAGMNGSESAEGTAGSSGGDGSSSGKGGNNSSIATRSVPDTYPQVMALPITRRPLFPGFYKAVVIRDQQVIKAIKESIKRGQPYIGAFLLKDENADSDMCVLFMIDLLAYKLLMFSINPAASRTPSRSIPSESLPRLPRPSPPTRRLRIRTTRRTPRRKSQA